MSCLLADDASMSECETKSQKMSKIEITSVFPTCLLLSLVLIRTIKNS